jgi:hypothetical protein
VRFLPARTAQINQPYLTMTVYFAIEDRYMVYTDLQIGKYCRHGYEPRKTVWVYNTLNLGNKQWTGR